MMAQMDMAQMVVVPMVVAQRVTEQATAQCVIASTGHATDCHVAAGDGMDGACLDSYSAAGDSVIRWRDHQLTERALMARRLVPGARVGLT